MAAAEHRTDEQNVRSLLVIRGKGLVADVAGSVDDPNWKSERLYDEQRPVALWLPSAALGLALSIERPSRRCPRFADAGIPRNRIGAGAARRANLVNQTTGDFRVWHEAAIR
jgi:hypothetical protein